MSILPLPRVGRVPVLAHPGYSLVSDRENKIRQLVRWGLKGLEAIAPLDDRKQSQRCWRYFSAQAAKFRLIVTGGSDFHGEGKPEAGLGLRKWNWPIPVSILEKLYVLKSKYDLGKL